MYDKINLDYELVEITSAPTSTNRSLVIKNKYLPEINVEEWNKIHELCDMLAENNIVFDHEKFGDAYFIRFLRARNLNVKKAYEMFTKYLNWREREKVDEIYEFQFPEYPLVKKFYPSTFHKTDKIGRPFYFEVWDDLNANEILKITSIERFLRNYIKKTERVTDKLLPSCSNAVGRYIGQSFIVIDTRDFNMSVISTNMYKIIQGIFEIDMNYYPEMLGECYILSKNVLLRAAWAIVSAFLAEGTKKKINMIFDKIDERLLEKIDADNLPKIFGGNCECEGGCINNELGPWMDS